MNNRCKRVLRGCKNSWKGIGWSGRVGSKDIGGVRRWGGSGERDWRKTCGSRWFFSGFYKRVTGCSVRLKCG